MHISDVSMHKEPELAQRESTERLGVGKAMPGEVLWHSGLASSVATETTIENQAPK